VYPGDPSTPFKGSKEGVERVKHEVAENLLKIPVLPISYHDAAPLLKDLAGAVVPKSWAGALPFTYHFGPSVSTVHLNLKFDWKITDAQNVIATIKGSEFPDQWVIRGNHHDAWVNGANDPISGLAAELEEAISIGQLLKTGWKPKRTLVYCAWDAEEPGLMGSTEWVEDHQVELKQKAVAYINSDGNARGFLEAQGSHAFIPLMSDVAKAVIDPQLQLTACSQTLDIFSPSGNIKPGSNTIGIRCAGDKPWTIYSVVNIKAFVEIYILNQGLKRNELIRMDHLRKETRDAGMLPKDYVVNVEEAINKQASRNIPAGSLLTRSHFSAPTLVKRGERISIQSGKPGLLISMQGIAIMDGIKGQQIPVKNASSQRVIHATVTAPGQVTVTF